MIFKQHENGGGEILFKEEEIKILNKTKKLILTSGAVRDFGNNFIKIIIDTYEKLPEKEKQRQTQSAEVKTSND